MVKKSKILILTLFLMLVSFFYFLPTGSANEDNKQSNNSEIIDEIKKNPQFITSRGSFPETANDDEIVDFSSDPVYKCWSNMTEINQFFNEYEDLVIGFDHAGRGYLVVELESDFSEKVNETTIDEIYQIIDDYCEQEGVGEVPVVFMWSHITEDLPLPDYGPESFEEAKKLFPEGLITTRGTMPEIHQEEEKREWIDLLAKAKHSLPRATIEPYFAAFGGPVNSFGIDINGYLIAGFEPPTQKKVNESVIGQLPIPAS